MQHNKTPHAGVVPMAEISPSRRSLVGSKAANLGELLRQGFPVPEGFIVVGNPSPKELKVVVRNLGGGPLAVRSSALAEDLSCASFAGQYDTVLGVRGEEELVTAVRRVRESALGARVETYREERHSGGENDIAVLVQQMLNPEAAGVAFTANPVTGDRREVVITAARGLGERVVAGEAVGDEWIVRSAKAVCTRSVEDAIDADLALAIADLARRIEAHFGGPQDVEWAVERGRVHVLQARPMTALPDPVDWTPPEPGYWMRNFRLGEWLHEPVTPLFGDWLLERIEDGYLKGMTVTAGAAIPFRHAVIHGWYYTSAPNPRSIPKRLLHAAVRSRGRIFSVVLNGLVRAGRHPERADRALLSKLAREWREQLLPTYRIAVAEGERKLETAAEAEIEALVDGIGRLAGEYLWSIAIVGGSAWKMEGCLATFMRRELPEFHDSAQALLRGLARVDLDTPEHAVQSVDWYWPTAGELEQPAFAPDMRERRHALAIERQSEEDACRKALVDRPAELSRFNSLLELAQRYAVLREEQCRWFTLGWPLLRRCALRLGMELQENGIVRDVLDVFFLNRAELQTTADLHDVVAYRRQEWERQRKLVAPLTLGRAPRLMRAAMEGVAGVGRDSSSLPEGAIVGEPASPGRATGPVRIVCGPEDFHAFQEGEVLVARATAPAWTPLFGRAAAVVTDGGTLAAHASLVAREYGIPAVVATGDATNRLKNGQVVTVDGSLGVVTPQRDATGNES